MLAFGLNFTTILYPLRGNFRIADKLLTLPDNIDFY